VISCRRVTESALVGVVISRATSVIDVDLLFAAHRDRVFRYLCRIVGPRDARDLTQEVFLRAVRGPVPDASEEVQRAWIFRVARNLALNHLRDGQRQPLTVELADAGRPATQEMALALDQALASLAALDRDVFLLREAAGLSYEEIALARDLSVDAVGARLRRARLQLRELLRPLLGAAQDQDVRLYGNS
jgi:RNA polymerase sigma-70 factor (ECF subfamily)